MAINYRNKYDIVIFISFILHILLKMELLFLKYLFFYLFKELIIHLIVTIYTWVFKYSGSLK